jgi:hypothetical protein
MALVIRFSWVLFFALFFCGCSKEQLLQHKIERLEHQWSRDQNWPIARQLSKAYAEFRQNYPQAGQKNSLYAHSLARLALETGKTTLAVETLMLSLSKDICSKGQMQKNAFLLAKIYRQRLQEPAVAAKMEEIARKGCQKWNFEKGFLEPECL